MENVFVNKDYLMDKMKAASHRVRILGVVAFDFDWFDVRDIWFDKINSGTLEVTIIAESMEVIQKESIISADRRASGLNRSYEYANFQNIINAVHQDLRKYYVDRRCKNIEPKIDMKKTNGYGDGYTDDYVQRFSLKTCYLQIPYSMIDIDGEYFVAMQFTKYNDLDSFERIDQTNPLWKGKWEKYVYAYFDSEYGAQKYSTEDTRKGNRLEVIQDYSNDKRIPLGLLPRDSFLKTSHAKNVIWALIFTRDGKMLIQKRAENAKDNQGMWDKSVGGHVSIDDVASEKAAAREIAEELFTMEADEQGGHDEMSFLLVNEDKMIFLGEWLPDRRYIFPSGDINNRKEEYYFFRIDYEFSKTVQNSPRYLPDGTVQDVSVYADVFVCVAPERFGTKGLKNADYALVEPYQLKDAMNDGELELNGIKHGNVKFSPDMNNILRSSLWQKLVAFSDYLVKMSKKK